MQCIAMHIVPHFWLVYIARAFKLRMPEYLVCHLLERTIQFGNSINYETFIKKLMFRKHLINKINKLTKHRWKHMAENDNTIPFYKVLQVFWFVLYQEAASVSAVLDNHLRGSSNANPS